MNKLTSVILSLLLVLVLATASGNKGFVFAQEVDEVAQEADELVIGAEGYYCFENAWAFAISNINTEADAPATITVKWGDISEVISLAGVEDGFAVYITESNLGIPVTDMSFDAKDGWEGEDGIVLGPCFEGQSGTSDITPSVTNTVTPSVEPTPSISSVPNDKVSHKDDVTPTPTCTPTPTPSVSSGPTTTPTPGVGGPKEVLSGITTMAKAGTFEQNVMNLSGIFGMLSILAGSFVYAAKRNRKITV